MMLLVGNPTAQSGKNAARVDRARTLLLERGVAHEFLRTAPAGQTIPEVAAALRTGRFDGVIAMGGDGTFREVAAGLLDSGTGLPLAILPTGTANDQGRSFGLSASPSALERNVAVVAAGRTVPLDAGRVTIYDHLDNPLAADWFFDSLGWGLSARVLKVRNEDRTLVSAVPILRELYRDQLVYAGAIVQALLAGYVDEQAFDAEVTTPAGTVYYEGLTDLIVKNTRYYAGAWIFDDTASSEDGEMELVPMRGRNELISRLLVDNEALRPLAPPLPGPLAPSPITRSSSFFVRPHERPGAAAVDAQIDGEEYPSAAGFKVEVHRHALRLVVPEQAAC